MELQWKLGVAMGSLERGLDQGQGGAGERRGAGERGTARGPSSTQGKEAGMNSTKAAPSDHPTDN